MKRLRLYMILLTVLWLPTIACCSYNVSDLARDYYTPYLFSELDVFASGGTHTQEGLVLEGLSSDGSRGIYTGSFSVLIAANFEAELSVELAELNLSGRWQASIQSTTYRTPGQAQSFQISVQGTEVLHEDLAAIVPGARIGAIQLYARPRWDYKPSLPPAGKLTPERASTPLTQDSSHPDPYRTYSGCACGPGAPPGTTITIVPSGPGHIPDKTQWKVTSRILNPQGYTQIAILVTHLDILNLPGGGRIKIADVLIDNLPWRELYIYTGFYIHHVGGGEMKIHGRWPHNYLFVDDNAPDDPGPNDPNLSDPNEDGSPLHPYDRIQEAINRWAPTVLVRPGRYRECIVFGEAAIAVISETGPAETIIFGDGCGPVIRFSGRKPGKQISLEGFTITNGGNAPDGLGGGIVISGASPLITRNIITGNCADDLGGGIHALYNAHPIIMDNIIVANEAGYGGGGIALENGCLASVKNNLIVNNRALSAVGGGVFINHSSPEILNNTIVDNHAAGAGGGVYLVHEGQTILINNIIVGNQSDTVGGGISNNNSLPLLSHNNVWGNSAILENPDYDGLTSGPGGFSSNPLFVGTYHLSQTPAGQSLTSPCVDTGNDSVENLSLQNFTTRMDGVPDSGTVDLGYHWDPIEGPFPVDITPLIEVVK